MAEKIKHDSKGRFIKGIRYSRATEFKPGQHWRPRQKWWSKRWLISEYKKKSAAKIAADGGVTENAILFWLKKHGIPCRTPREAALRDSANRAERFRGEKNPAYGKRGALSPAWKGGVTAERQAFYASLEWAKACRAVWAKDKGKCQECGAKRKDGATLHIHHIVSFTDANRRAEVSNLVLLCQKCHLWVHSKRNKARKWLAEW